MVFILQTGVQTSQSIMNLMYYNIRINMISQEINTHMLVRVSLYGIGFYRHFHSRHRFLVDEGNI